MFLSIISFALLGLAIYSFFKWRADREGIWSFIGISAASGYAVIIMVVGTFWILGSIVSMIVSAARFLFNLL